MSDSSQSSRGDASTTLIRNQDDFSGGLALLVLAGLAAWAIYAWGGMALLFGYGFLPLLVVLLCAAGGVFMAFRALMISDPGLIRNVHDFWGSFGLLVLAGLAAWATHALPGEKAFLFGYSLLPLLVIVLFAAGTVVVAYHALTTGDPPFVRNFQDFWGGFGLVALALIAWWASRSLPGQQGFAFGPGTAPRLFMLLLGVNGVIIMALGLVTKGPDVHYSLRSALVVVAIAALWLAVERLSWVVGQGWAGPIVATALLVIGSLAFVGFFDRLEIRGPYFVTLSVLAFAAFIRPFGLIPSTFLLVVISAAGTREVRWVETVIWAALLAAFCAFLFPYVLNLPMQLWPRFW